MSGEEVYTPFPQGQGTALWKIDLYTFWMQYATVELVGWIRARETRGVRPRIITQGEDLL